MTKRERVKITMINEQDGYAECDTDQLPRVLELLTGKKLEQGSKPKKAEDCTVQNEDDCYHCEMTKKGPCPKHEPRVMLTFPAKLAKGADIVEVKFYKNGPVASIVPMQGTTFTTTPHSLIPIVNENVPRAWYLDAMDQITDLQAKLRKKEEKSKSCENCNRGPRPTPFHHWCETCTRYDRGVLSPKVDRWEAKQK
jgi:hypothetical protein